MWSCDVSLNDDFTTIIGCSVQPQRGAATSQDTSETSNLSRKWQNVFIWNANPKLSFIKWLELFNLNPKMDWNDWNWNAKRSSYDHARLQLIQLEEKEKDTEKYWTIFSKTKYKHYVSRKEKKIMWMDSCPSEIKIHDLLNNEANYYSNSQQKWLQNEII